MTRAVDRAAAAARYFFWVGGYRRALFLLVLSCKSEPGGSRSSQPVIASESEATQLIYITKARRFD